MPANIKKPKPPIYPPLTTKLHGGSGREGEGVQSRYPLLTAATDKSEALSKHGCPKTPSFLFYPLLARHLGTPLVFSSPSREEQETDSLTLSPLLLLLLLLAFLLAAVEGRGEAEILVPLRWLSLFLCLDGWGFLRCPPAVVGCTQPQYRRQSDPSAPQDCSLLSASFLLQSPLNASFTAVPHYICRS